MERPYEDTAKECLPEPRKALAKPDLTNVFILDLHHQTGGTAEY